MSSSRDIRQDLELLVPGLVRRHLKGFALVALFSALVAMAMTILPVPTRYGILRDFLIVVALLSGISLARSPLFHFGEGDEQERMLNRQALARAYVVMSAGSAGLVMMFCLASDLGLVPGLSLRLPDAPFFLALIVALGALPAFYREPMPRAG